MSSWLEAVRGLHRTRDTGGRGRGLGFFLFFGRIVWGDDETAVKFGRFLVRVTWRQLRSVQFWGTSATESSGVLAQLRVLGY